MKVVRWGNLGAERPGLVDAQGRTRNLSGVVGDSIADVLSSEGLSALRVVEVDKLPEVPVGTRSGVPVAFVSKIVCVGLNDADHAAESNMPIPKEPVLFLFSPVGPWPVTTDEIPDPGALQMSLKISDRTFQHGSTSTLIFGVPGVALGQKPPVYREPGDVMDVAIEGLGAQRQVTRAWSRDMR